MKIFVTGSMINSKEIEFAARALNTVDGNNVKYAKSIDEEIYDIEYIICQAFNNIEWCDSLYVVKKHSGELEPETIYEIEYARRLRKEIFYLN